MLKRLILLTGSTILTPDLFLSMEANRTIYGINIKVSKIWNFNIKNYGYT
ncbi:hypothetical protein RINTHM_11900 [Richelia intracellularis HM01]|nr:hypothetical protein RINTHM_11900 [Richelia intracellularis HM01]